MTGAGVQVAAGQDWLVHVQRDRECAGGALCICVMREHRVFLACRDRLADERLPQAQVRQAAGVVGGRLHGLTSAGSLVPDVLVNIQVFLAGPGP